MSIPTSAAGGSGSHTERSKEKIQFLRELYSAARGDTTLDVNSDALARKLNQDENVAMGVIRQLEEEGE